MSRSWCSSTNWVVEATSRAPCLTSEMSPWPPRRTSYTGKLDRDVVHILNLPKFIWCVICRGMYLRHSTMAFIYKRHSLKAFFSGTTTSICNHTNRVNFVIKVLLCRLECIPDNKYVQYSNWIIVCLCLFIFMHTAHNYGAHKVQNCQNRIVSEMC